MKDYTPSERTDVLRGLDALIREKAKVQLVMSIASVNDGVGIGLRSSKKRVRSYSLEQGEGILYVNGVVKPIGIGSFRDFCGSLLDKIDKIEGDIGAKLSLNTAVQDVESLLRNFLKADFSLDGPYFQIKYAFLRQIVETFRNDLTDFPMGILDPALLSEGKLEKAQRILEQTRDGKKGSAVYIGNLRALSGFRKLEGDLLFDPIECYYTDNSSADNRSRAFRRQLAEYAKS